MDRRKFIQTGIAGVAGLSLVRTGLANIQTISTTSLRYIGRQGETGKDRIESLSYSYGNRDERLELPVQSDSARTG